MEQPAEEHLRRPDAPHIVLLEKTAFVSDIRPRGVLAGEIDGHLIRIKPVVFPKALEVLVGDSRSATDIHDHGTGIGAEFLVQTCPVDAADEERPDPVKYERVTKDALIDRHVPVKIAPAVIRPLPGQSVRMLTSPK